MKSSLFAWALSLTTALAIPVAETSSDNTEQAPPQFLVSKFDVAGNGAGEGWLFSPPGMPNSAMVRFYQNNNLMGGRKGSAWVLEVQEDVDAKQIKALANVRNAFNERPVARPFTAPQRPNQASAGFGAGTARSGSVPATPAAPAAPAALVAPAAPAAPVVPAVPAAPAAPVSPAVPAGLLAPAQLTVPAALLAPAGVAQGGPTITGLITQAGQLIGQQIGVSIGNLIGSTLEGVVTNYFPAPKAAGGS